tara:strand:- start:6175 stop:6375 length:201 start_codon:yes stop_codon:yes gene_type:complete
MDPTAHIGIDNTRHAWTPDSDVLSVNYLNTEREVGKRGTGINVAGAHGGGDGGGVEVPEGSAERVI